MRTRVWDPVTKAWTWKDEGPSYARVPGHSGSLVVGSSNPDQEAARRYRAKKREEKAA